VREAGGWTNDFLADDGLTRGNLVIASTPELQAKVNALIPNAGKLSAF
jgi:myo-inositol-1(or 4)-monophosphatase